MDTQTFIYNVAKCLPGLLFAIIIHEVAHAYIAKKFGDDTAERAGRISLNPAVHFDLFGTVILPAILLYFFGSPFGYAKPVPINPSKFSNYRKGLFWVSFAGPLSNLIAGTISSILLALISFHVAAEFEYRQILQEILRFSITINFVLMGFNLIPFPPLDGSNMLMAVLKGRAAQAYDRSRGNLIYVFYGLMALSLFGFPVLHYIVQFFSAPGFWIAEWVFTVFAFFHGMLFS